jgi:lactoylglutathione lyase
MEEAGPYVMPSFVKLLVSDRERSRRFYEALGFELVASDPVFLHLRWTRFADLFLVSTPPGAKMDGRRGLGVLLCFTAGEHNLAELAGRAEAQGATVEGPARQPWHTREVVVTDPDGYRLNFVEPA